MKRRGDLRKGPETWAVQVTPEQCRYHTGNGIGKKKTQPEQSTQRSVTPAVPAQENALLLHSAYSERGAICLQLLLLLHSSDLLAISGSTTIRAMPERRSVPDCGEARKSLPHPTRHPDSPPDF